MTMGELLRSQKALLYPGGRTSLLAANWDVPLDGGRIFTTGLTIMGSHFQ